MKRTGESRTVIVIAITAAMMVVEIAAGILFGSMALLADGLHMGSHAAALTVTAVAYVYARRHAGDPRYSFGTGKVNALGGFSSAVLLALFSLIMVWESGNRLLDPVVIRFDNAILVAVIGLVVNGASALVLGTGHDHGHGRGDDDHDHDHAQDRHPGDDHNLRAAYIHVLADALTSVLAIVALLAGKHLGLDWMDPVMGFVGAGLVARWSWGLLRDTGRVLLDRQALPEVRESIRATIEGKGDDRVADLHLWSIGPGIYALSLSVVTDDPKPPDHYKAQLPRGAGLVHSTVEVVVRSDRGPGPRRSSDLGRG